MKKEGVDDSKRQFLTSALTVVGAIGTGYLAVPFLSQMQPSVKALAAGAPVEVDLSKLEPGQKLVAAWRGKPVWIVSRTPSILENIKAVESQLSDPGSKDSIQPAYAKNEFRSIKPEVFVVLSLCTHLGCSPTYRPEVAHRDLGEDWKGGFFCPCHGSKFDMAGRVYSGVPAPTNLEIPPHRYLSDSLLLIGEDEGGRA
jgi:ubiquinol-cytochrome c reductase iron-sulfur subunit